MSGSKDGRQPDWLARLDLPDRLPAGADADLPEP
jgi:hypothetical protein